MKRFIVISFAIIFYSTFGLGNGNHFKEVLRFDAKEARQGVAVDENYIYVIGSREIGKYDKTTGDFLASWKENEYGPIIHLDSGVIVDGKLYCAHSNYPKVPMTSSVEIWDAETLKHVGSHSFGIHWGSCTWVDYYNGFWWAAFAQYDKWQEETGKGTEWTTLVKFDENWHYINAWVFPDEIIERFRPMSNSGGSWGPDGLLYCTGHDRAELYALQIPGSGTELKLIDTVPIDNTGQGIAWDRSETGTIYTISKKDRQVRVFQFSK